MGQPLLSSVRAFIVPVEVRGGTGKGRRRRLQVRFILVVQIHVALGVQWVGRVQTCNGSGQSPKGQRVREPEERGAGRRKRMTMIKRKLITLVQTHTE